MPALLKYLTAIYVASRVHRISVVIVALVTLCSIPIITLSQSLHSEIPEEQAESVRAIGRVLSSHPDLTGIYLKELGFEPSGFLATKWQDFPAIRKLETAYLAAGDDGKSLLSLMARTVAARYPSVALEPHLQPLLTDASLFARGPPFRFHTPSVDSATVPFDRELARYVDAIAKYSDSGTFGGIRGYIVHYLGLPSVDVYEILRTSESNVQALRRAFLKAGVPPTLVERLVAAAEEIYKTHPAAERDVHLGQLLKAHARNLPETTAAARQRVVSDPLASLVQQSGTTVLPIVRQAPGTSSAGPASQHAPIIGSRLVPPASDSNSLQGSPGRIVAPPVPGNSNTSASLSDGGSVPNESARLGTVTDEYERFRDRWYPSDEASSAPSSGGPGPSLGNSGSLTDPSSRLNSDGRGGHSPGTITGVPPAGANSTVVRPAPSNRSFDIMIRNPRGFGGVIFGSPVISSPELGRPAILAWVPNPIDSETGHLLLRSEDGTEYISGAVRLEHAVVARHLVNGFAGVSSPKEGEGIGLVGIHSRVPFYFVTSDTFVQGRRYQVVMHPALSGLSIGWATVVVDSLPLARPEVERLLQSLEGVTDEEREAVREWLGVVSNWKVTDVPMIVGTEGGRLILRRASGTFGFTEEHLRSAFLDMLNPDGPVIGDRFYRVVPLLTRISDEYRQLNEFAQVVALYRWAQSAGAALPAPIETVRRTAHVGSVIVSDRGLTPATAFNADSNVRDQREIITLGLQSIEAAFPPLARLGEEIRASRQMEDTATGGITSREAAVHLALAAATPDVNERYKALSAEVERWFAAYVDAPSNSPEEAEAERELDAVQDALKTFESDRLPAVAAFDRAQETIVRERDRRSEALTEDHLVRRLLTGDPAALANRDRLSNEITGLLARRAEASRVRMNLRDRIIALEEPDEDDLLRAANPTEKELYQSVVRNRDAQEKIFDEAPAGSAAEAAAEERIEELERKIEELRGPLLKAHRTRVQDQIERLQKSLDEVKSNEASADAMIREVRMERQRIIDKKAASWKVWLQAQLYLERLRE